MGDPCFDGTVPQERVQWTPEGIVPMGEWLRVEQGERSPVGTLDGYRAALWEDGDLTELVAPSGDRLLPKAADRGRVLGHEEGTLDAFHWENGELVALTLPAPLEHDQQDLHSGAGRTVYGSVSVSVSESQSGEPSSPRRPVAVVWQLP